MRVSCSPFFCKDETSDSKFLQRNAIQLNPPKFQKVSLKKCNINELGYRSQYCIENRSKNTDPLSESWNITQRIAFSSQRKLMRSSLQQFRSLVKDSQCTGFITESNQKRMNQLRVKKRLNGRKKEKSDFGIDKNLIAIEFQY